MTKFLFFLLKEAMLLILVIALMVSALAGLIGSGEWLLSLAF